MLQWEDLRQSENLSKPAINTGWNTQPLLENEAALRVAKEELEKESSNHPHLSLSSSKKDLDSEVLWFETALGTWLDRHAKITRVTSFSKRWWNDEVAQAMKPWAREKRRLSHSSSATEELKKARNAYYHVIRKAKRECWQNFLQGEIQKNNCVKGFSGEYCHIHERSMKDKEILVRKTAFPSTPKSSLREPRIPAGTAHLSITKEQVYSALMAQSTRKAPGSDG